MTTDFLARGAAARSAVRAVLAGFACAVLLLPARGARADVAVACPAKAPGNGPAAVELYKSLRTAAEGSPFYKAALAKAKLTGCATKGDESDLRVVYTFGRLATLEVHATPDAGFVEHVLLLGQPLAQARALAAQHEKFAWPPTGCGIDWKKPAERVTGDPGTQVEVHRAPQGTNCSARLTSKGTQVVSVRLSSAG